ncbi:hypothetical protein BS78_02G003700 [Paspalum vaginatum]|nr:hypothetical protein BS78_02G003700 [Paspalum vaginatum]
MLLLRGGGRDLGCRAERYVWVGTTGGAERLQRRRVGIDELVNERVRRFGRPTHLLHHELDLRGFGDTSVPPSGREVYSSKSLNELLHKLRRPSRPEWPTSGSAGLGDAMVGINLADPQQRQGRSSDSQQGPTDPPDGHPHSPHRRDDPSADRPSLPSFY